MIPYDPNSAILQFDGNRMDLVIEYRNNIRGPYSLALQQILDKMRTTPLKGRFVILIKIPFKEFQLAQLSGTRGRNPEIVKGVIYKSIVEAEWDIFKRRWFLLTGIKVTVEDPKL
ncbi:MAG: hypothetical protein ACJZ8H_04110 [Paracoccaceae bacterium]